VLGCLCLSDSITLLMELEYVGWSLFVRWYIFTSGTLVCWVVFVCERVSLYSWDLSMLGGLCLSDSITLILGFMYAG
jgi:hypothetical protein